MKQEISSLELYYLMRELQCLVDAKLDKVFQPMQKEFLLQFHKSGSGKYLLRIVPGKILYLTDFKLKNPEKPSGYCMYLRKYLGQGRLKGICQRGFERVIELVFEVKRGQEFQQYKLFVELFGKGNLILTNKNEVILSPLETQIWSERVIKSNESYKYPRHDVNFLALTKEELRNLLKKATEQSLVKVLAVELGLGGIFAEEICALAKVDKKLIPHLVKDEQVEYLFEAREILLRKELKPFGITGKDAKIGEVLPFMVEVKKDTEDALLVPFKDFNLALDSFITREHIETTQQETHKEENKALLKAQQIVEAQEKHVTELEEKARLSQLSGELIYNHYILVKEILDIVKKAREKYSWAQIKETFKKQKGAVVKDIDESKGIITINL